MKLSYIDLLGDGERHEMQATITTDHPASSYGQPVILIEDGQPLDLSSWVLLSYQVIQADQDELVMLKQWLSWIDLMGSSSALNSEFARRGGSATSERKKVTARENGKKGGRPRKKPAE